MMRGFTVYSTGALNTAGELEYVIQGYKNMQPIRSKTVWISSAITDPKDILHRMIDALD